MIKCLNIRLSRNGGIWMWEFGRIGGSFYVSSPATYQRKLETRQDRALTYAACVALQRELDQPITPSHRENFAVRELPWTGA